MIDLYILEDIETRRKDLEAEFYKRPNDCRIIYCGKDSQIFFDNVKIISEKNRSASGIVLDLALDIGIQGLPRPASLHGLDVYDEIRKINPTTGIVIFSAHLLHPGQGIDMYAILRDIEGFEKCIDDIRCKCIPRMGEVAAVDQMMEFWNGIVQNTQEQQWIH